MKALVDQLSVELSDRYVQYLETFMIDLWSEAGELLPVLLSSAVALRFGATTSCEPLP